jgi:hypothetical protein
MRGNTVRQHGDALRDIFIEGAKSTIVGNTRWNDVSANKVFIAGRTGEARTRGDTPGKT